MILSRAAARTRLNANTARARTVRRVRFFGRMDAPRRLGMPWRFPETTAKLWHGEDDCIANGIFRLRKSRARAMRLLQVESGRRADPFHIFVVITAHPQAAAHAG